MKNKSKLLAYLLRHDISYNFDNEGWRLVEDLLSHHGFSLEELEEIAANDSKGRYEFSQDHTNIRARWGHSVTILLGRESDADDIPDTLYHGTADAYLACIHKEGIRSKGRQFVHLTNNRILAIETGKRHGRPVVLAIDSRKMKEDGIKFWKRNDTIWLTKEVGVKYISNDDFNSVQEIKE